MWAVYLGQSLNRKKTQAAAAFSQLCVLKISPPDYTSAVSHSINRARHGARTQELASPVFLCFLLSLIYLNLLDLNLLLFRPNDSIAMTCPLLWFTDLDM